GPTRSGCRSVACWAGSPSSSGEPMSMSGAGAAWSPDRVCTTWLPPLVPRSWTRASSASVAPCGSTPASPDPLPHPVQRLLAVARHRVVAHAAGEDRRQTLPLAVGELRAVVLPPRLAGLALDDVGLHALTGHLA